jgi:hypothetical protein
VTLAQLVATDVAALWAALPADRQAAIGIAAISHEFAMLVRDDDGTDTTIADHAVACDLADVACQAIPAAVEVAFPQIKWWAE